MASNLLLLVLHNILPGVFAFVATSPHNLETTSSRSVLSPPPSFLHATNINFDDENVPPNPDASPGKSDYYYSLRSSYPLGTPAGLRGEAIRSALTSTQRCLVWRDNLLGDSGGGVLQIQGPGTLEFLHNKLTADFSSAEPTFQEACLLDAKGRLVDLLRISRMDQGTRALILTSPGHSTSDLLQRLEPFVFPMDQVSLTCFDSSEQNKNAFMITIASTQWNHVQEVILKTVSQKFLPLASSNMVFPGSQQSAVWKVNESVQMLVVPSVGLSAIACVGYTLVFFGSRDAWQLGQTLWQYLIAENNADGPVEVGPREYETLRVQAGQPAYGHEFGPKIGATAGSQQGSKKKDDNVVKTSPLELHWKSTLNLEKGCYLGQEGISSILKNPRGPPRLLYSVVFQDDFNTYEVDDTSDVENLTTLAKPGQNIYALGSNEQLLVGTLTSVGEAGGTGRPETVALALVKRVDSIQKQMKELELEIPRDIGDFVDVDVMSGSGIIRPPPMDPLDGLEVIVEGTFTMGVVRSIPSRRLSRNANMFDNKIQVRGLPIEDPRMTISGQGQAMSFDEEDFNDSKSVEQLEAEAAKAAAEAEVAAAEAKRKAEKMELLKKRAEEAMARRKQMKKL